MIFGHLEALILEILEAEKWLRLESCLNVWLRLELSLWIEFEKKRVHCIGVIERCEACIRYPFDNTMLVA